MQQVTRKTLGAGINLTCVTTPKFKRAVLRTMLVLPLGGEDAALRACLPQVLRRGTARLNDMQAFGTALDELYGARIEAAVRKEGENLCIGFLSDCIDEAYAPGADGLTAGVIGLLCDLLYNPYLQDGLFCAAYVEGERGNLIDRIATGVVVDYINVLFMNFAIFNFADICVCVGVGLLMVWVLFDSYFKEKAEKSVKTESAAPTDDANGKN